MKDSTRGLRKGDNRSRVESASCWVSTLRCALGLLARKHAEGEPALGRWDRRLSGSWIAKDVLHAAPGAIRLPTDDLRCDARTDSIRLYGPFAVQQRYIHVGVEDSLFQRD